MTLLIVLFLIFLLILLLFEYIWSPEPWPDEVEKNIPIRQSHRGLWTLGIQENTISAFRKAAEIGLQMIELDVRISKDKVPVVVHDDDLIRISGKNYKICQLTSFELKKIADVPTLEEVLSDSEIPDWINIEIKHKKISSDGIDKIIAGVINKYRHKRHIVVSSFNPFILKKIKKFIPNVLIALLAISNKRIRYGFFFFHFLLLIFWVKPHILHLDHRMINNKLMRKLKRKNIPVVAWTVNDEKRIEELIRLGVTSVITDLPLKYKKS